LRFPDLSPVQSAIIVQAMSAVASADGKVALLPIEIESLAAIERHVLRRGAPSEIVPGPLPQDLAAVIDTPDLRRQTVRLLAILPVIDGRILPDKVRVVEEAAARLGVAEFGLAMLRHVADGRYRSSTFGLMKRFLAHYWSFTGKAAARDWLFVLFGMLPWLTGLRRVLKLDELLARYRCLATLPENTLGRAVHRYYTTTQIVMPGMPKSVPEGWARHEVYHVISNYNINHQGELLLSGFIAGNTSELCLDVVLPALVQLHAGKKFVPGPVAEGLLKPDEFFRAVARGNAMTVDLLGTWRLWDVADVDLEELRQRYKVPPFSADEHKVLAADDALLVACENSTATL
jgi:hypothetical protein